MRLAALIILCVLVIAASALRVEPMKPDARLPTFAERNDPNRPPAALRFEPMKPDPRLPTFAEVNDRPRPAPVPESAEHKQIRQAMLNAANRLENSPCDKSLRQPLRTAVSAYIKAPREDVPGGSDEDQRIVRDALAAGILQPTDIFPGFGRATLPVQSDNSNYRGRFVCNNG